MDLLHFQTLHDLLWPSPGSEYTTPVIINDWVVSATALALPHQPDDEVEPPSSHMVVDLACRTAERVEKLRAAPDVANPEHDAVGVIQSLLPCKTSRLLIRPAYVTFLQIMEERDRIRCEQRRRLDFVEPNTSAQVELLLQLHVIVTGQPGIGVFPCKGFLAFPILTISNR